MVLNLLRELSKTPKNRLSAREISRVLEINPMAVSRALKQLKYVLDVKEGSDFESFRLKVYLIRLKDQFKDLGIEDLVKRAEMAKKLDKEIFRR
ncbi:hypothetical protein A3K63_00500 [Candidatus Micrarchaeota archaeon RBG_16_49_10]|nr:MAG: hypothetical protein A3K63_00500 [Candidatus Micrarchaeota archaeon RBG_16_49_10]